MSNRTLITIINLLFIQLCFAQTDKTDSLINELPNYAGLSQAKLLCHICNELNYSNPDSARYYCYQAISQARQLNNDTVLANAFDYLGIHHRSQAVYDSSIIYHKKALNLRTELGLDQDIAASLNNLAIALDEKGLNNKAIVHYMDALNIYEKLEDQNGIALSLNNLAIIYKKIGQFDKALEYYLEALSLYEALSHEFGITIITGNIGAVYLKLEKYEEAIEYSEKAAAGYVKLNVAQYEPYALSNMAVAYKAMEQYEEAMTYAQYALDKHLAFGTQKEAAFCYNTLAEIYFEKQNYSEAIRLASACLSISQEVEVLDHEIEAHATLSKAYAQVNNFKLAYQHSQSHLKLFSDANEKEKNQQILALQTEYETEKKEQEIKMLAVQNELKDNDIRAANNRFYAALIGAGLLVILAYSLFSRYKHKQRVLLLEEKAKNQKLGFKSLIEGEEKERKRIAQELHDGLGQLLSSARLNVSAMEDNVNDTVEIQWKNSIKLIDDAVTEVRSISHNMMPNALISIGFEAALKEQIHIINDAGLIHVHADFPEEKIELPEEEAIAIYRVIQEILNNALKYANANNIWLKIDATGTLNISIKDDGKGFDTNILQESSGIGWQNIQSRVDILNAELNINSKIGQGSEISLKMAV